MNLPESNSKLAIQKRKCQDALKLCGLGMIVFAFWSFAKFLLELLMQGSSLWDDTSQEAVTITMIFVILLILADFLLRVYVSRKIGSEADGNPQGNFFLVVTAAMLLFNLGYLFSAIVENLQYGISATYVTETTINIVDDIVMAAVIVLTIRFRNLSQLAEEEA